MTQIAQSDPRYSKVDLLSASLPTERLMTAPPAAAPAEMDALNRYLAPAWNGSEWLRPWNGAMHDPGAFRR